MNYRSCHFSNYLDFTEFRFCAGKEEVKVYPNVRLYTFELACRLFMSIEDQNEIEKLATLFDIFVRGVISMPINFPGTNFYNAKKATIAIKKELQMLVRQRRFSLEQKTAVPSQDLLSHLLSSPDENGKFMSESVIVNNIVLLLFAGCDTSSAALTILMKYLAELPEIYEKVLKGQPIICFNLSIYHTDLLHYRN